MNENEAPKITKDWSASIAKIAPAFVKFQAEVEAVKKGSNNPFFKSKYADLASVRDAIRDLLAKNDLAILQEPGSIANGKVSLASTLIHASGEYMRSVLEMPLTKTDAQGCGSAITYARRYAMQSIAGVTPEDDDGNAAVGHSNGKQPQFQPQAAKPPTTFSPNSEKRNAAAVYVYDLTKLPAGKKPVAESMLRDEGATFDPEDLCWFSPVELPKLAICLRGAA